MDGLAVSVGSCGQSSDGGLNLGGTPGRALICDPAGCSGRSHQGKQSQDKLDELDKQRVPPDPNKAPTNANIVTAVGQLDPESFQGLFEELGAMTAKYVL